MSMPSLSLTILLWYHSGEYVGVGQEGNLYKGIVAFMVVGLKQSKPFAVQVIPQPSQARSHI